MLNELEPEIQGAAKHMFDRLISKEQKKAAKPDRKKKYPPAPAIN